MTNGWIWKFLRFTAKLEKVRLTLNCVETFCDQLFIYHLQIYLIYPVS